MVGSKKSRFRGIGALALAGLCAAGLGCASSSAKQDPKGAASSALVDVRVESSSEQSRITLVGPEQPVFTAFQQDDPPRVVVDLSGVGVGSAAPTTAVEDGVVREVTVSPVGSGSREMARVEIALDAPAAYDVVPVAEGLAVRIVGAGGVAEAPEPERLSPYEDDPWAAFETRTEEAASPEAGAAREKSAPEEAEAPASGPASRLVSVETDAAGSRVRLVTDGSVSRMEAFTLEEPDRLVIDLPGLASALDREEIAVDAGSVSRVRVGSHADKVRVVLDASAAGAFDARRITPVDDGLVISLGEGGMPEAPAPRTAASDARGSDAASETGSPAGAAAEPEEPSDAGTLAQADAAGPQPEASAATGEAPESGSAPAAAGLPAVYGVEFDSGPKRDRLVVLAEEPLPYRVYEPDAETLVLSLEQSRIEPEAVARLTPEGGPVSLVSVFQQPDVAEPEVRVVLKRAKGLAPEISRSGSMLIVEFPRGGAQAAKPPVLAAATADAPPPAAGTGAGASSDGGSSAGQTAPASVAEGVAAPAAMEGSTAIDILQEGGLFQDKEYRGKRLSLHFKEVDIADVIRLIGDVTDLNVIAGDEVSGNVTIRLIDVPWDQALDVILHTKGLGFQRVGNVLRIAPKDMIAQEEELRLQERRAKEKLEDLIVKLQPVNYADAKQAEAMVARLLTPRGTVNTDTRTNTLIIKDIPSVIDEAVALVHAIDTQTPQVMIEAKIVEASLDFSREFGSVWSFGSQPLVDGFDDGSDVRRDLGSNLFRFEGDNNFTSGNPITAGPTALANLGAFILDEKLDLELQLQAAESSGDGKVISSPRLVTLDNSEATIEQGVSIPFQTFENGDAQLEFVDAVLSLTVTPHITADQSIIMEIEVTRNAPDDSVFTLTGSPAIAKNQVETETLVKDGQTLVIGGIYVVDKSTRQSRVPYLHRIPVLGMAFRSDEFSDSRKELLIFVTPKVVQSPEAAT